MQNYIIFNEEALFYDILRDTYKSLEFLQEKDIKSDEFKSINRIYGNIFVLFLRQGFQCIKRDIDETSYYVLKINDKEYYCGEEDVKSILFKDYERVIKECLVE